MKRIKRVFTLLIFPLFSIAAAFTGCSAPVGSLLADIGTVPDSIQALPKRHIYTVGQMFLPADVEVWKITSSGRELVTDTGNIKFIIEGDNWKEEVPQDGIDVGSKGSKTVFVSYQNMDAHYRIQIVDDWMPTDGDGIQIEIEW